MIETACQVSRQHLSKIESGEVPNVSFDIVNAIAFALGCRVVGEWPNVRLEDL